MAENRQKCYRQPMRIYLINLERRPDRLAAMRKEAEGLVLTRVEALDAAAAEPQAAPWARFRAATNAVFFPIARPGHNSWRAATPMPCSWKTMCGCPRWRARF